MPQITKIFLTADQASSVLSELITKKMEVENYLSSHGDVSETPSPTDTCCEAHYNTWLRKLDMKNTLTDQLDYYQNLVNIFTVAAEE